MSVYSDRDLEASLAADRGLVVLRDGDVAVEPSSIDVHLGEKALHTTHQQTVVVDDESTYPEWTERDIDQTEILPGQFVLATTEEVFGIPKEAVAFLHGRSSVGRLGLFVENAGLIDSGYQGEITLELFNAAPYPLELRAGMRIGQVTVHEHTTVTKRTYGAFNGNKYNCQSGPTPSRLHEDFITNMPNKKPESI